ncbi:MAG: preprotein translocase subunit YajC [bacterium]|nr:preprotein translocase subunit YajC [bacterium]
MISMVYAMGQSAAGGESTQGTILSFLPLIIIFVIFYFLLMRPQMQQQKKHQELLKNLKKGDKVITGGGIYGTISGFKGENNNIVTLEVADKVNLDVTRSAIANIQGGK